MVGSVIDKQHSRAALDERLTRALLALSDLQAPRPPAAPWSRQPPNLAPCRARTTTSTRAKPQRATSKWWEPSCREAWCILTHPTNRSENWIPCVPFCSQVVQENKTFTVIYDEANSFGMAINAHCRVCNISSTGMAYISGIRLGDQLLTIDGSDVLGEADAFERLRAKKNGEETVIAVMRKTPPESVPEKVAPADSI